MISIIFWEIIVYLTFVKRKKLTCPHCGEKGISANRKYFLSSIAYIPFVRIHCFFCGGRSGVYFWRGAILNIVTVIFLSLILLDSLIKVGDRFIPNIIPISGFMLTPIVLIIDVLIRLYVIPTKKYNN